ELNRVRREIVSALEQQRAQPKRWTLNSVAGDQRAILPPKSPEPDRPPELIAVIRLLEQLDAAWSAGARTIYCEFENPKYYRDAVARFRTLQHSQPPSLNSHLPTSSIWVAPPRIFKPGEEWVLKQVRSSEADGYLIRNYD